MFSTIHTPRLMLRRLRFEDAPAIYSYASSGDPVRYMAWPRHQSLDDTRAFLEIADRGWQKGTDFSMAIILLEGEQFLGTIGIHFERDGQASMGYILCKKAWGKGYATEAAKALIGHAFRYLPSLHRIYACAHPEHSPSFRVMEKLGMEEDKGICNEPHDFPNLEGAPSIHCPVYAITREQYEASLIYT